MEGFGTDQATKAKYFYEKMVYAGWPFAGSGGSSSLATNTTTLFNANNWNPVNGFTWQARLEMVQATRNSDVYLKWSGDGNNNKSPGVTNGFPANYRQQPTLVSGVNTLSLNLDNNTGAAIADWQTNYSVAMKRLTAAEKLLAQRRGLQGYDLTSLEQQALKQLDLITVKNGQQVVNKKGEDRLRELVDKGTSPIGIERMIDGIYANRIRNAPADPWAPLASSGDNSFATYNSTLDPSDPTKGEIVVLTEIAFEPASSPPNATLTIDRDGQAGYATLNSASFVQTDEAPWQVWLPATNYLTFHITNGPGATGSNTVNLRLKVARIQMSEVIAIQFGLITQPTQLSNQELFFKVIAGVI